MPTVSAPVPRAGSSRSRIRGCCGCRRRAVRSTVANIHHIVKGHGGIGNGPHGKNHMIPLASRKVTGMGDRHGGLSATLTELTKGLRIELSPREGCVGIPTCLCDVVLVASGLVIGGKLPRKGHGTLLDACLLPTSGGLLIEWTEGRQSSRGNHTIGGSGSWKPFWSLETLWFKLDVSTVLVPTFLAKEATTNRGVAMGIDLVCVPKEKGSGGENG